jgi:hypothetical protein
MVSLQTARVRLKIRGQVYSEAILRAWGSFTFGDFFTAVIISKNTLAQGIFQQGLIFLIGSVYCGDT